MKVGFLSHSRYEIRDFPGPCVLLPPKTGGECPSLPACCVLRLNTSLGAGLLGNL